MLDDGKAKEFKALGSCEDASRMARYAQACSDDISFTWDSYSGDGDIVLVEENGKYGYIDAAGKLVIPCEWDDAGIFDEGIAPVEMDGKWGCIDTTGKTVVPCGYDDLLHTKTHFFALKNGCLTIYDLEGRRVF